MIALLYKYTQDTGVLYDFGAYFYTEGAYNSLAAYKHNPVLVPIEDEY